MRVLYIRTMKNDRVQIRTNTNHYEVGSYVPGRILEMANDWNVANSKASALHHARQCKLKDIPQAWQEQW